MPAPTTAATYDVAVVGAGIVGLAVAREVLRRRPGARVVVVEQEADVAAHQTGHNSGVVHGGIYYQPGSLKAQLCVEGARLMYDYCAEHGVAHERSGKLIVARHAGELGRLDELYRRGLANQTPGLRRVDADQVREIEPHAVGVAALHAPDTGIVDFAEVARAIRRELEVEGVDLRFDEQVLAIDETGGLTTGRGRIRARRVIACAGLWADRLARAAGADANPRIVPFRGGYLALRPTPEPIVRGMIYPVPDPELPFLGVHLTRHLGGEVSLGPTALLVAARDAYALGRVRGRDLWESLTWPGTWRVARRHWRAGAGELLTAVSRRRFVAMAAEYVPGLTTADLAPGGTPASGPRPSIVTARSSTTSSSPTPVSRPSCAMLRRRQPPPPSRWPVSSSTAR
ncbi:L-2-hydroxyglutarate oxidase [Nocardioides alcanivorans]|uniref:L-2-hydroxyglutarate oxidase n=1 Tax=Nocardioides alcanivorans TaxID=2897352 RepID=UPI001F16D8E8|nr:L-2-hydroxyglutarate oxidase [Nocardioides alcanivorans]